MLKQLLSAAIFLSICAFTYGQTTYTFTNCSATGAAGPSQTQVNNTYTGGNTLTGQVTSSAGIQQWTVPTTGTYRIAAYGAQGGGHGSSSSLRGGLGAKMEGDFALTQGEVLHILVGQQGAGATYASGANYYASGGGGTFVVRTPYNTNPSILLAAGGGGGKGPSNTSQRDAQTASSGKNGLASSGAGGMNGNGGAASTGNGYGAGGAGFFTDGGDGTKPEGGFAFVNGGGGGVANLCANAASIICPGGFGGGGCGEYRVCASGNGQSGAGGGGYSGGGGGSNIGGGAGSYNTGTNQSNADANRTGHGQVVITFSGGCEVPTNLSYTLSTVSYCLGVAVASNNPTFTGDAATSYSISPALPTGLMLNTSTGVISGTPSAASAAAGYTVTVTNACGSTTADVNITVNALPSITTTFAENSGTTADDGKVCAGASVTITASGATTYAWSPATDLNQTTGAVVTSTPTTDRTYTITGTDANGCIASASASIVVNDLPTVSLSPFATLCETGGVLTLSGGSPAGGSYFVDGNGAVSFDPSVGSGNYTITYEYADGNNCSATATETLVVDVCTGIGTNVSTNEIKLFPNPAVSEITISGFNPAYLRLVNTLGQVVVKANGINQLYVGNLPNGLYVLQLFDGNGKQVKAERIQVTK